MHVNKKADLQQGYAKIASGLLEALATAPLTEVQFRIVLFVIRRTYGWSKMRKGQRDIWKADELTAEDMAEGTGISVRTVERALTHLLRDGVLFRIKLDEANPASRCLYGINTYTEEWGDNSDWTRGRIARQYAQERSVYTHKSVSTIRRVAYRQYAIERRDDTQSSVAQQALNPTGTGLPEPLHTCLTNNNTDSLTGARQDARANGPLSCVWKGWKHHGNGDGHVRADDPGLDPRVREFILSLWPRNPDKMRPGEEEIWDELLAQYLEDPNHPEPRRWFDAEQRRRDQQAGLHVF